MAVTVLGDEYNNQIRVEALYGPKGEKGDTGETGATGQNGKGILKIEKTSSYYNDDTYTITYTDGTTFNYIVHNGENANVNIATEFIPGLVKLTDIYNASYGFHDDNSVPTMATVLECETRYMNNCILRLPTTMINFTWFVDLSEDDFTLFAGSYYDKPNGGNIPEKVTLQDDLFLDYTFTTSGKYMIFPLPDKLTAYPLANCYCRTSAPTVSEQNCIYYNKTTRKLYQTSDGGTTWAESSCGMPIATVDYNSSDNTLSVFQRFDSVYFLENTVFYPKDTVISMPQYYNELTGIKDGPMVIFNDQKMFTLVNTSKDYEVVSVDPEYNHSEYDEYLEGGYVENSYGFEASKTYLCYNSIENVNVEVETDSSGDIDTQTNVEKAMIFNVQFANNRILYVGYLSTIDITNKRIANWNTLGLCKAIGKSEDYDLPVAIDESGMLWQVGLDSEPVEDSEKGITSGAVHNAIASLETQIPTVPTNVSSFTNDANYVNNTVLQQNLLLSNALITGNVSDNAVVYADILSRYRSSFDLSKFTVVGSPTINKGIVSVFSPNNYITFPLVQLGNYSNWKIDIEFATSGTITGLQRIFTLAKNVYYNGVSVVISSGTLFVNVASNTANATNDIVAYSTTAEANKKYQITIKNTGTAYVGTVNGAEVFNETSSAVCGTDLNFATIGQATSNYFIGSVDLTKFVIYGGGNVLVSGMNRGADTYTVDGNTVTIPYTVTKNGAKIVDSAYRTAFQSVYNATGSALYYTLDEANQDFTLPAGDLYGMLQQNTDQIGDIETILQSING